ncbi:hypothetical protein [Lewinella sp. W8]|uniref:hypothetical protein n=1 Tax=Lewinella sp. W8 TaxID=2528208 RepID=UPI00106782E5|nr:hypothetical protein [Lewinella sp. W8]MTB49806.1 hypothetical protein [Lewinella sp. W8]
MDQQLAHPHPVEAEMPIVDRVYALKLDSMEVDFLKWFIVHTLEGVKDPDYLLELCTLAEIGRRFRKRFDEPRNCTMNLLAHEAIALKRMLWLPKLPNQANVFRNAIHGRLDQLMPGIH